jgi:Domain of unknown function (DUF4357)
MKIEDVHKSFSIRIFLADGSPSGLKFVEKSNWSGLGVVCPRPRFSSVKTRVEFDKAAVYLLLGPSETSDIPLAYIGQGDPVKARIEQHHSKKDFWTIAYFFTSKDANLNKAHIQYLEHRLISIAKNAKRCKLENNANPAAPSLSEAELSDVEAFLEEMLLCFPVLGVTVFENPEIKIDPKRILLLERKGIHATGYESEDGFVVCKGSTAVAGTVSSIWTHAIALREELKKQGILIQKTNELFELTQDYAFSSPSLAAGLLVGASINGRDVWRTYKGITLKQLQEAQNEK